MPSSNWLSQNVTNKHHTFDNTTDNLELAQQQYKKSIEDAKNAEIEQAKKDSEDAVNRRKQFVLDSTSTKAQIDAFEETRREFEIQNDSYLQVDNFDTSNFRGNAHPTINYRVINLGQPAKVKKWCFRAITNIPKQKLVVLNNLKNTAPQIFTEGNLYVIKEAPQNLAFVWDRILDATSKKDVLEGKKNLYFFGQYFYTNLIDKKNKVYEFIAEYNVPNKGYTYRFAENSP